jgi:hypothetical protein
MNATTLSGQRHAGVDWSWDNHAVCVVGGDGQVIQRFTVAHTAAGLAELTGRLGRLGVWAVAIERGDGPVVAALLRARLPVVVITSRQVTALRLHYGCATARPATKMIASMPTCWPTCWPTCCAPTITGSRR